MLAFLLMENSLTLLHIRIIQLRKAALMIILNAWENERVDNGSMWAHFSQGVMCIVSECETKYSTAWPKRLGWKDELSAKQRQDERPWVKVVSGKHWCEDKRERGEREWEEKWVLSTCHCKLVNHTSTTIIL